MVSSVLHNLSVKITVDIIVSSLIVVGVIKPMQDKVPKVLETSTIIEIRMVITNQSVRSDGVIPGSPLVVDLRLEQDNPISLDPNRVICIGEIPIVPNEIGRKVFTVVPG